MIAVVSDTSVKVSSNSLQSILTLMMKILSVMTVTCSIYMDKVRCWQNHVFYLVQAGLNDYLEYCSKALNILNYLLQKTTKLISRETIWNAQTFLENMPNLKLKSTASHWNEPQMEKLSYGTNVLFTFLHKTDNNCYF